MKRPLKSKRRIFAVIMGIVWGVLIVSMAISIYRIYHYDTSYNYYPKVANLSDPILTGNYASIYSRMESISDAEDHPEYSELVAVHDYLAAAAHYKVYKENGLEEEASKYLSRMEDAKNRLGDIAFSADEIDAKLDIE